MELINTIIMLFWAHIIPLSIKGGIIIVLYFFIRVCFAKKCPSQFLFLIWLVIFIRLSIPFEPAVDCSLFTFFTIPTDAVSNIWQSKMHPLQPMKTTPQSTVNSIAASSYENKINAISRREGPESTPLLPLLIRSVGILWIVGVLLIIIKSIIVSILFTVRYKKSKTYVPSPINLLFKQISQEVGIRSKLEISRTVQVPCVSGVFRPTVIFPASLVENLNKNEIRHIFLHELVHIKRKDMLSEILLMVLGILYWFHPLLHKAMAEFRDDRECACDADSLALTGRKERIPYGKTIIHLLTIFSTGRTPECTLGIMDTTQHISRRLLMIKQNRKKTGHKAILGVIVFCAAVLLFTTKNTIADTSIEIIAPNKLMFAPPVSNPDISLEYGWTINPLSQKKVFHNGIDLKMPVGTPVMAISDGKIVKISSRSKGKYGIFVMIENAQGYRLVYTKLSSIKVKKNQGIQKGDIIGLSGNTGISTGPHMHFMILKDNRSINPREFILF